MAIRGVSVGIIAFLPWLKKLNEAACEMSPWPECEIHMGNARSRLRINDFNPTDRTHAPSVLEEGRPPKVRDCIIEASQPDMVRYFVRHGSPKLHATMEMSSIDIRHIVLNSNRSR